MADASILGLDLGTTAVKAALIGADGRIGAQVKETYATHRGTGGKVEQDARLWLELVRGALSELSAMSEGSGILGLGVCSQVNTHVFLDAQGAPLAPAMLWQDTRAAAEAAELDARLTDEEKIALLGAPMPIDASHALPRMLWMARHHPDLWTNTKWVMLPKDFVLLHLTGRAVTDPLSNIGLVGADLAYAEPLFDLVPGARERMAPIRRISDLVGQLRPGEPGAGLPVVNGTMDAWAGLVGAGGTAEGASVYLSGTSEIMGISSRTVVPTPGAIVFPEAAGLRLHAAPTQNGGDAKLWFSELSGLDPSDMADLVARTPRSAATPLFLPQLGGERAPLWNPDLRGAFLGIGRSTGQGDLARAVYEGVALQALWALETLEASACLRSDVIFCGGGGFRSDPWAQIRADIFGRELHCLTAGEPGVMGAAALASVGVGLHADFRTAQSALATYDRVFRPDPEAHARYRALSRVYREAVEMNAAIGPKLMKVMN